MKKIFVTATDTNAGKTVVSAILCKALGADYWKPVQTGEDSDSQQIAEWIPEIKIFPERYKLKTPVSPHEAAEIDGIEIELPAFLLPPSNGKSLIIEGAGGLLVPLNEKDTVADLIGHLKAEVILVSRHYLGSINHTLLSADLLKRRQIPVKGIIFNGKENPASEKAILGMSGLKFLGRIEPEPEITEETIERYAKQFRNI